MPPLFPFKKYWHVGALLPKEGRRKLTAVIFITVIPTVIHQVTDSGLFYASSGVMTPEIIWPITALSWEGKRAVFELDVVNSRDAIIDAKTDFIQGQMEGLSEASKLNGCLRPLVTLII